MAVSNSGFNGSEVMHMQQDAIRRVREMQRKANEKLMQTQQVITNTRPSASAQEGQSRPVQNHSHQNSHTAPPVTPEETYDDKQQPEQRQQHESAASLLPGGFSLSGILDKFNIDQDRALLLLLIVVLLNEGADTKLILALCYLLI